MSKKLFVISGPSGSGKDTISRIVLKNNGDLKKIITYTTRGPREKDAEQQGVHYHFINKNQFLNKVENDFFIDWQINYDAHYGTSKESLFNLNSQHLLVIDVKGAHNLKEQKIPDCVYIFIDVPFQEIKKRLEKRDTETVDQIKNRLRYYNEEMNYKSIFDYVINNDVLDNTVDELQDIITKHN